MALDTKPNLNSSKFEQQSGDILNLSGCTHIYGQFILNSGATLSILDNYGDGKIMMSDSTGVGTWQNLNVGNGITMSGNTIVLGGILTGNTTINLNSNNLILDNGDLILTKLTGTTVRIVQANTDGSLSANTSIVVGKITNATIISLLTDENNWSVDGEYIGIEITGTFEGQYYANDDYYFFAYDDNLWLRMIRG